MEGNKPDKGGVRQKNSRDHPEQRRNSSHSFPVNSRCVLNDRQRKQVFPSFRPKYEPRGPYIDGKNSVLFYSTVLSIFLEKRKTSSQVPESRLVFLEEINETNKSRFPS